MLLHFQVTFCIRHVNPSTLEVQEDCLGLYATDKTNADTITKLILDSLVRFNLPLNRCRGQCYDGASNMCGRHTGVATQIRRKEPRAMYIHCMAHSLNLAIQDTCRSIQVMSEVFDIVLELSKLFKYSAKKKAMLLKLKSELAPASPGMKPLCPTRWTVRAESLRSIILNYTVILAVLQEIVEEYKGNFEACCQARGILAAMEKFHFLFGITLSEQIFSITDSLSKAFQKKDLSAIVAKKGASLVIATLKELRCDSKFSEFWKEVTDKAIKLDVGEPTLPRRRKLPPRLDESNSTTFHDSTPENMYKRYYFELIDTVVGEIERRLDSPSFTLYAKMELLLKSAAEGKEVLRPAVQHVVDHFQDDLELNELCAELSLLKNVMALVEFTYTSIKEKIYEYRAILPQVAKLIQLLFVIPATSATSERSFSSLRLLKSFLRTTMSQNRLNYLMLLYIHKDRTIDMRTAMREFINNSERRQIFRIPI